MGLTIRSVVVLVALLSGLAGCSTATGSGQPRVGDTQSPTPSVATDTASPPSKKVTTADYEAAVSSLETCLKQAGLELFNDGWDPVDNERMLLRYKAAGMSFEQGDDIYHRCAVTYLEPVENRYNQDNKSHMEPALMTAVQACLKNKKISVSGREDNPTDLLAAVPANRHQDLRDCVRVSVKKVYNDLATSFP
ncbi:hypothetical protein [Dactylosporangium sp. NPDC005555]|uniref:hypothetical protein n=1 Tax=Dactylosporangium sp. NPDC005555 TaxID=3154889 RepID=UPI0033BEF8C5